ncbi:prenyltransferase/squalene oxidase repeat-containing protein [Thermogutta sp.]|uniref:prenyltransferase/squalene oxidase repeat-containing protein n=1 Tax=Thermogutta sp. TaxID=1962930 RepID=UPI00321FCC17
MFFHLPGIPLGILTAIQRLPSPFLVVHRDWLGQQQQDDGGFPGRNGGSSLYYSAFAARLLALIGCSHASQWQRLATYLKSQLGDDASIKTLVDLDSAVTLCALATIFADQDLSDLGTRLAEVGRSLLKSLQREDGGFAKAPHSAAGSTYHTFLAIMAAHLLELPLPDQDTLSRFFAKRQRSDGGFVELPMLRHSGTNPTAAAVTALAQLGRLQAIDLDGVHQFFASVQKPDGGFAASAHVGESDLLSTCSALISMSYLKEKDLSFNLNQTENYCLSLANASGGFFGHHRDDQCDVEYTFYGILSLAALQMLKQRVIRG